MSNFAKARGLNSTFAESNALIVIYHIYEVMYPLLEHMQLQPHVFEKMFLPGCPALGFLCVSGTAKLLVCKENQVLGMWLNP